MVAGLARDRMRNREMEKNFAKLPIAVAKIGGPGGCVYDE